jgi:hypothetical protein
LVGARRPLVTLFSLARTMPSEARMPTQVPALLMASMAYSTWCSLPSGEKVVVEESYRRAMVVVGRFLFFVPGAEPRGPGAGGRGGGRGGRGRERRGLDAWA